MREIILDTETTGLEPKDGHRMVEIGCIELWNHIPTGKEYHTYLNPEREVPQEAFQVHGLSFDFLQTHPLFSHVVEGFLEFIQDSPLVIHNASFDVKFLNAELLKAEKTTLNNPIVDTLIIARRKFPGAPASLDALCRRFKIDNSNREKHGALLDSKILAEVYLELLGGRQQGLGLETKFFSLSPEISSIPVNREIRPARDFSPSAEELENHHGLIRKLKTPLWEQ